MAPGLCSKYGVTSLFVFGSVARGEQRPDSDIDLMATFDAPPNLRRYMGLKLEIEDALSTKVDLTTPDDLVETARARAQREAVRVA
jgi:predicted nucleotidyltransferase